MTHYLGARSIECSELHELYWDEGWALKRVGEYYRCSPSAISSRMDRCGIQRRECGHARKCPGCDILRRLYWDEGKTLADIAREYNCAENVVKKNMQRCGIDRRPRGYAPIEIEGLAEMYEGMSVREISDYLGVCHSTVTRAMDRADISRIRGRHTTTAPLHKFFGRESAELYYIVGLLFADGNISRRGIVTLSQKDPAILYEIGSLLSRSVRKGGHVLTLGGVVLAQWLLDGFGIGPCKSKVLKWPVLPCQFEHDFIRGFFDGDGSIWFGRVSRELCRRVSFTCGSREFLYELRAIFCEWGAPRVPIYKVYSQQGSAHRIIYGGKARAAQFYDYMYYPGCLCMGRKAAIFEEAIATR